MKNRSIFVLILMGLVLIGTANATGLLVQVNPNQVGEGKPATIPVIVSGASNLGAMDLTLTYDPAVLKFSKVEPGDLSTNGLAEGNEIQPGLTKVSFADTKGISGDGSLLKVTFDVIGAKGSSTNLALSGRGYGLDLKDIPTTAQGATITVSQPQSPLGGIIVIGAIVMVGLVITLRKNRQ